MTAKKDSPEALTEAIERARTDYLTSLKTRRRLTRQFMDGVVRGLGFAFGGTIVFGILVYLLGHFFIVPKANTWLNDLQNQAQEFQKGFGSNQ